MLACWLRAIFTALASLPYGCDLWSNPHFWLLGIRKVEWRMSGTWINSVNGVVELAGSILIAANRPGRIKSVWKINYLLRWGWESNWQWLEQWLWKQKLPACNWRGVTTTLIFYNCSTSGLSQQPHWLANLKIELSTARPIGLRLSSLHSESSSFGHCLWGTEGVMENVGAAFWFGTRQGKGLLELLLVWHEVSLFFSEILSYSSLSAQSSSL